MTNEGLIDEYEIAFSHEIASMIASEQYASSETTTSPLSLHMLIDFLQHNLLFTRYGFYKGFSNLLWAAIFSDSRSQSDNWLLSVLVKLSSLGISDDVLIHNIQMIFDQNIDKYVNATLGKVVMLHCALNPENPRYREPILRRLRSMNPDTNPHVQDIRFQSALLLAISNLETKPTPLQTELPFRKYLAFTMKSV